MSNNLGFFISKLQVSGHNLKPAIISFDKGFNVISGPSDTGKSYIYECIDYMLGGADIPKIIPESTSYTDIFLEIKTYNKNIPYTLHRSIKGGNFKLKQTELPFFSTNANYIELKSQHSSSSKDNISSFLLGLSGFEDKWVKRNNANAKRELSFRDIIKLILADEQRIITKGSAIYFGQYTEQTQEQSVFEIVLTGNDAKALAEVEEAKVYVSRIRGKVEFIDSIITELTAKIKEIEDDNTSEKQDAMQQRLDNLSNALSESSLKLENLGVEKQAIYNQITELESKGILQDELSSRFILLKEHYNSDIKRLDFITEGDSYLNQLNSVKCPLCESEMDKEHYDAIAEEGKQSGTIINSIEVELEKIQTKLADLTSTLERLDIEKQERKITLRDLRKQYDRLKTEIRTILEPIQSATKEEIGLLVNGLTLIKEHDVIKAQLIKYYDQKALLTTELSKKPTAGEASKGLTASVYREFCAIVLGILTKWKYPNITAVNFDPAYKVFDLQINNRPRTSHGKGIRAITYTSFLNSVMDHCYSKQMPHPGFIMVDSPLTTYQGKEVITAQDELPVDMQDAFFNDLSTLSGDKQIIVIDNKEPKQDVIAKINYIHFSGDKAKGRSGFFE